MPFTLHISESGNESPKEYPNTFLEYIKKKLDGIQESTDVKMIENQLSVGLADYFDGSEKSYEYLEKELEETIATLKTFQMNEKHSIEKFTSDYLDLLTLKYMGKGYHHHFDNDPRLNLIKKVYFASKSLVEFYRKLDTDVCKSTTPVRLDEVISAVKGMESDFHSIVKEVDRDFPYDNFLERKSLQSSFELLVESSAASEDLKNEDFTTFTLMADELEKVMREDGSPGMKYQPRALKNYFFTEKVRIYAAIEEETKNDFLGDGFEQYKKALLKREVILKKREQLAAKTFLSLLSGEHPTSKVGRSVKAISDKILDDSEVDQNKITHSATIEQVKEFFGFLNEQGIKKRISQKDVDFIIDKYFDEENSLYRDKPLSLRLSRLDFAVVRRHIYIFFTLFGGKGDDYTKMINSIFGTLVNSNNFCKPCIGYNKIQLSVDKFKRDHNIIG